MTETLPPLVYGKVIGRFLAVVGDQTDADDYPDAVPLAGTVTFTPSAGSLLVNSAAPVPATVLPAPIQCVLDDDGYLTYNTNQFVYLLATDDPNVNPTGYTYEVSFALKLGTTAIQYQPFSLAVPASGVVDLTTVAPVGSSGGVLITQGPKGDNGDLAQAVPLQLSNGILDLSAYTTSTLVRLSVNRNFTSVILPTIPATVALTVSLVLTQDSTGSRTITWPAAIKWPYGVKPVLSTAAGAVDLIHLMWTGASWVGMVGGLSFA